MKVGDLVKLTKCAAERAERFRLLSSVHNSNAEWLDWSTNVDEWKNQIMLVLDTADITETASSSGYGIVQVLNSEGKIHLFITDLEIVK